MKKTLLILALAVIAAGQVSAQKFFTRAGYIGFLSATSLENIKGDNNKVTCVVDASTGAIQFEALIKSFAFDKALLEEHFNENYMESSKFPKATFKGMIVDPSEVNWKKDGTYAVVVKGDLTMHGVTKAVETNGTIKIVQGKVTCESKFNVNPRDYQIDIPEVVKEKISDKIEVIVRCALEPMN